MNLISKISTDNLQRKQSESLRCVGCLIIDDFLNQRNLSDWLQFSLKYYDKLKKTFYGDEVNSSVVGYSLADDSFYTNILIPAVDCPKGIYPFYRESIKTIKSIAGGLGVPSCYQDYKKAIQISITQNGSVQPNLIFDSNSITVQVCLTKPELGGEIFVIRGDGTQMIANLTPGSALLTLGAQVYHKIIDVDNRVCAYLSMKYKFQNEIDY